jgi:hypothetical protein
MKVLEKAEKEKNIDYIYEQEYFLITIIEVHQPGSHKFCRS